MQRTTLALALLLLGCASAGCSASTSEPGAPAPDTGKKGKTFATADEAPTYDGAKFHGMQILDLESDLYLDETALLEALDEDRLIFFGEQHETAPIQELELWMLERLTARHPDVSLAMEHFQHDEQPIIDKYLAGTISTADFEKTSQPWKTYATYWKPLVEHMKAEGLPVIGLNVPDEVVQALSAKYPASPLTVFNAFDGSYKYDASIAPRPLAAWDATYKAYFAGSFDYEAHGGSASGMTEDQMVTYFTDLALVRDETMGYFAAKGLEGGGRVFTVAGDWHVQTGLATPDRAARYAAGSPKYELITTSTPAKLAALKSQTVASRKMARFVLVYSP
jgi:uncharacterized iron-regulated protein